jgi:hypothetical protein
LPFAGTVVFAIGASLPDTTEPEAIGPIKDVVLPDTKAYNALAQYDDGRTDFGVHSNVMSNRLAEKLLVLSKLVRDDGRFSSKGATLVVTVGYTEAPADVNADTVTYHHEGRAIAFGLSCDPAGSCDAALHGELARLAYNAGFDWVTLVDANTVCVQAVFYHAHLTCAGGQVLGCVRNPQQRPCARACPCVPMRRALLLSWASGVGAVHTLATAARVHAAQSLRLTAS